MHVLNYVGRNKIVSIYLYMIENLYINVLKKNFK